MRIETERLLITEFDESMVESVHLNSLDEDNRRFVPDEVFETIDEARETVEFLISCYRGSEGPYVYPIVLHNGTCIGHVQVVQFEDDWEIGYHVSKAYSGKGYASEAVAAFLPIIKQQLGISSLYGICLAENVASHKVLLKSGFRLEFEGMSQYQGHERHIHRYRS